LLADTPDGATWELLAPPAGVAAHPGELVMVDYRLINLSDRPLVGRAVPSYAPAGAATYFKKIECFCFREQRLAPRESLRLPVLFVIDRQLPADTGVLTVSYRFYPESAS
jgi:cytochrome c oxidase assembly protein subunit 11